MHSSTCLLQGFWGRFRSPRIGTPTKASTMHQAHKCVLPSLLRACALKENQDLPNRYQWTNCRYLNKGSSTEHLLQAPPLHVWTVTYDALVRECEVYYTTADSTSTTALTLRLMLQPYFYNQDCLFSPNCQSAFFCADRIFLRGIRFEISRDSNLMYQACYCKGF